MSHSRHIKRTARRKRALVPSGTKKALPEVYLKGGSKILPEIYMTDHGTHKGSMFKWMLSTMFAGVVGVGAIGTVLYASLDPDEKREKGSFVAQIQKIGSKAMEPLKPLLVNRRTGPRFLGTKSDRLIVTSKGLSTRHIIHDTFSKKRDNRDYLVIKPYALITTSLATARPGKNSSIPIFDAYKLYTNKKRTAGRQKGAGSAPTTGSTTKTIALALLIAPQDEQYSLSDSQAGKLVAIAADDYFAASDKSGDQSELIAAGSSSEDSSGVPAQNRERNTTIITRTAGAPATDTPEAEQHIKTVRSGDTMNIMLQQAGAENWQSAQMIAAMSQIYPAGQLKVGQKLRYVAVPKPGDGGKTEPAEIALYSGKNHLVTVARNEDGKYVASAKPGKTRFFGRKSSYPRRATLYQSFYHSGLLQKLSAENILKLLRIHAIDTDFKRRTQPGDSFEAFFDMHKNTAEFENIPNELLYTSVTINGDKRAFYRFRTPDGVVDYYDSNGDSAKKFLMRKPVRGSRVRLSSGFGMRFHPIVKRMKAHNGTDWAAARGTPILAGGSGIIEKATMTQFSGNYIRIRHANGYKTSYSHLHKFAKGIKKGTRVRLGQIIGQVGNTGRSTAPHLHYEVLINNRPVNAMTIPVPRGRELKGYLLTRFKKERDRIDELMSRDPVTTKVASARRKRSKNDN